MDRTRDGGPLKLLTVLDEYSRECLAIAVQRRLTSIEDAKIQIEAWRHEYNESCPHRALQDQTPTDLARNHAENEKIEDAQSAGTLTLQVV